jgi:tetratricopeptide (TPR) repeat protein
MNEGEFEEAESIFHMILESCPDFLDAYHHRALILSSDSETSEIAFHLWYEAVELGKSCFPKKFDIEKDLLEWGWLENRPFLRNYEGLALAYSERGDVEKGLEIFNQLLSLNPNDNQGIRALAIDANFTLHRPQSVLEISKKYPHDMLSDTLYGKVLALLQLGKNDKATTALQSAYERLPLVAEELIRSRHRRPKSVANGYITVGGKDQAYEYWKSTQDFWKTTPGAIEFVKEFLTGQIELKG